MPRVKKSSELKSEIIKPKKPNLKLKSVTKKPVPKKKAKPVVIDVIEDDEEEVFFPEIGEITTEASVLDSLNHKSQTEPEIDQQKKFFSELVSEIKEKNPNLEVSRHAKHANNSDDEPRKNKSVGLYRRLVWRFIIFTVCLLLVVFYFSFSKLVISISPKGEAINDNLMLKVQSTNAKPANEDTDFREQVSGSVKELNLSETKTFQSTGEEFTGEEISGQVKIINNSNKSQALVATTRILSPDNKLFRIRDAVNVPAGGEVLVPIYVEKPSEEYAIAPTSFSIPGLWLGLQDKIYAKSSADFIYQQKVKKYIKPSDIELATKEMNDILIAKAKGVIGAPDFNTATLYDSLSQSSFEVNAKAGEAKDSFTVTAKGSIVAVNFSKTEVAKIAAAKLSLLVPDDKELVGYDASKITYTFDNYDAKTGIAAIKASFTGTMVLKKDTELVDKKQLVNLSKQQLENYLKTFPEIKSYELKFFPTFITRAPRLPERIQIEVKSLDK